MDEIVPGPMRVMKWIEDEVAKAIKRGAEELQWCYTIWICSHSTSDETKG